MGRAARFAFGAAVVSVALAGSAAWSRREVRLAEEAFPPQGRFVELDGGARLHVVEEGDGAPLVLIHGADGIANEFTGTVSAALAAAGHRVVTVERPGHGWSPLPDGATPDVHLNASLIAEGLRRLGIERPILVGHSYGGLTALAMAAEAPDAYPALVLLAPVGGFPWPLPTSILSVLRVPVLGRVLTESLVVPLGRAMMGPLERNAFHPDPVPDTFAVPAHAMYLRPAQFRALMSEYEHLPEDAAYVRSRVAALRMPVEIVVGTKDRVTGLTHHSRDLAVLVEGAGLTVIEDAGHQFMWTHPDTIVSAVERAEARLAT